VLVGHKKMAQFEYKGSNLTSDIDVFDDGKHNITRKMLFAFPGLGMEKSDALSSYALMVMFHT